MSPIPVSDATGVANLRILWWESEGLRVPDFRVDLLAEENGQVPRVTFIQAPNGTAKTTTLNLLRATLSGEASGWGQETIAQFSRKNYLTGEVSKPEGHFIVSCLCSGMRYTFALRFDFTNNSCYYETTTPQGLIKEFKPAPALRPFLEPGFVRLFVFDGEQAEALSDRAHTKARDAIEVAHRIYLIGRIKQHVEDYYRLALDRIPAGVRGASAKRERVASLSNLLNAREVELLDYRKQLENAESKQATLDREWDDKFASLPESRGAVEKATAAHSKAEAEADASVKRLGVLSRNPAAISLILSSRLNALQSGLDRAKLPESTAKEFFVDLAEQDMCVCGRLIGSVERQHINDASHSYLASDAVHVLNRIKSVARESLQLATQVHVSLETALADCFKLSDEKHLAYDELERARKLAASVDPQLEITRVEIERNKGSLAFLRRRISEYEVADSSAKDEDLLSLITLRSRLKEAEAALSATTQAKDLVDKKNKILLILNDIVVSARARVTEETIASTNKLLELIIPLNDIRVDRIDSQLALRNLGGASMGETLLVAYAFLSSLLTASSGVSMPFIVDSPAGALGGNARREVAPVLPKMSEQLILFVLDKECADFLEPLESSVKSLTNSVKAIQYITLFKKDHVKESDCPKDMTTITKCGRGVIVKGRDFFAKFS